MLNIDLHCHSTVSDGLLAPAEVAARASANGVDVWALTDHDEVGGMAEARAAAKALGMRHVTGVEISITWAAKTIHIVGLQVDETNPTLIQGLHDTRNGREKRAREISALLADVGIPNAFEGALTYVGNPELISRTHFARFLVETGVCKDVKHVFENYLVEGKPGYIPHRWASLEQSVSWIRAAGGLAVVAHPGRYDLTPMQMSAFLDEFKQFGGQGIEVVTGSHTPDQFDEYAKVAQSYGLLASRGSDFHGPGESRIDLGALPPLPDNLKPVWHDWF
ncbi:3',5'-nucleoside bisphosphate phosphatase [Sapientia aquatica]|uniref:PHP domain-containing protein n=1 Tax=Sapientia aquatica TaxID=1549640 RepID=A0A4R5W6E0_9BURK|nr:3',5'-nucleoside bisphosphate phosphatase [Sapientia aquatica]TDK68373.1 PHP domain-containing protein [Sapientia aquatica]